MKRDDAPLSHLYSPAIKYINKLRRAEAIDSDMANRHLISPKQQFLECPQCLLFTQF